MTVLLCQHLQLKKEVVVFSIISPFSLLYKDQNQGEYVGEGFYCGSVLCLMSRMRFWVVCGKRE